MLQSTLNYIFIACACITLLIILNWPRTEHFQNTPARFPRIIHQYFEPFTTNQMPYQWRLNHLKWKQLHPDWEVRLWNETRARNLIAEMDQSFLATYDKYPYWVQKVDAVRPFILKKYGGVYIDLDTYPKHPIDNILRLYEISPQIEVLLGEGTLGSYSNWFMVSRKGSTFWDVVIAEMKKPLMFARITKHMEVMWSTGPYLINNCVKKYDQTRIKLLGKDILTNCSICDTDSECYKKSLYVVDQHASSWHSSDSELMNRVYCNLLHTFA